MGLFDKYMIKNLSIATIFIAVILSVVIILTQSLRFLELVIESGASSSAFWILTLLALPRFFEVILPLALMAAVIFTYSRMTSDSELIIMRASGFSPMKLARPAIILASIITIFLLSMTLWAAPKSLRAMQEMRQVIKSQFSTLLFREGIFNQVGSGLTVYIREKDNNGELRGMMIHDSRQANKNPSTIIAKRGVLVSDEEGFEVLVYEGSRQEYDPNKKILNLLNFDRYTIDLPESEPVRQRWKEPDERTIFELLDPDLSNQRDVDNLRDFNLEIHKRIISPLLAIVFTLISCVALLLGPFDRRGQGKRIAAAIIGVVVFQGLYLSVFNIAKNNDLGLILTYLLVFIPLSFCAFMLSAWGEAFRHKLLYKEPGRSAA